MNGLPLCKPDGTVQVLAFPAGGGPWAPIFRPGTGDWDWENMGGAAAAGRKKAGRKPRGR